MSSDRDEVVATAKVASEEKPYAVHVDAGGHAIRADEPVDHGGGDTGPPPAAFRTGACTAITLRMYAEGAVNHSGTYHQPANGQPFPKVQIVTVQELLVLCAVNSC
jgi:hypothetical protein